MIGEWLGNGLVIRCFMKELLIINKPKGITSFDVIRVLRAKFGIKKIGHGGTLDPNATGVLVLGLGRGTKKLNDIISLDKEYEAEITFGKVSDTYDADGVISESVGDIPDVSEIERILPDFIGEFPQMPPKFSAKKIDGRAAYKRARAGEDFEVKPALVRVDALEILSCKKPVLCLRVICGKGFYVRSLAHDLGKRLGCGAYLSNLSRTRVGDFRLEDSMELDRVC